MALAILPARPGLPDPGSCWRLDGWVSGTYRFIHPYREESLEGVAGGVIFFTDDVGVGCAPGQFDGSMGSRQGPFLLPSATPGGLELPPVAGPVPGKLYLADPGRSGPVTGSTLPNFIDSTGFPTTSGRLPGQAAPAAVAPKLSLFGAPCAGTVDAAGLPIPVFYQHGLADEVAVSQATYDSATQTLTVAATSSDETLPPTRSATFAGYRGDPVDGRIVIPLVSAPLLGTATVNADGTVTYNPLKAVSAKGGTRTLNMSIK